MAGPRLPFLWPMLYRTMDAPAVRSARALARTRAFHPPAAKQQETIPQRYGSANEPPPHLGGGKSLGPSTREAPEQAKLPKIGEKLQKDGEAEAKSDHEERPANEPSKGEERARDPTTVDGGPSIPIRSDPALAASESSAAETPDEKPLDSLLDQVPDPGQQQRQAQEQDGSATTPDASGEPESNATSDEHAPPVRAPHMEPRRHMHHFDTYGLVRRLADGGWGEAPAVTTMKAVRLLLADQMALARAALVSQSDASNAGYLFRAASAELRTEATGRRAAAAERLRAERAQLQHEVDILGQRVAQEAAALRDALKGLFDDRKLAARAGERALDARIHQLNYQITVHLQADAKSDVEGLRWVMTRRVILALAAVVIMVVGSLKLYSDSLHDPDAPKKGGKSGHGRGAPASNPSAEGERGVEERALGGEIVVSEGDNPGYVSLG